MKFTCNFCTEFFIDFLVYKVHLKSQHNEEKRVKVSRMILDKERISCVNSCNWLESDQKHILFNIDGIQYCTDCKRDWIGHLRIEKAYKPYLDKIKDLDDILYPDLWVQVVRDWFECCWCVDTRHGDEEGGTFYEFVKNPQHILCERCFEHLKENDSFATCQTSSYCAECNLSIKK